MILDEEVWRRHLAEATARDREISRLRADLEDVDAQVDRLLTRLQEIEQRLQAAGPNNP